MNLVLIVLNYNDYETTLRYLEFIEGYTIIKYILVVDNNSTNNSYKILKKYETDKVKVIKTEKNGGYAYGNNYGIKYAKKYFNAEYLIISNPDVFFEEIVINKMIEVLNSNDKIAIVAPKLINRNNANDMKGWKLPNYWMNICQLSIILNKVFASFFKYNDDYFNDKLSIVDVVPGSFFMIKTKIFYEINLFDENTFLYGEENIIAYKLKEMSYKNIIINTCSFYHEHSASINKTFDSYIKRYNILYRSLNYYNKKYLKTGNMKNLFFWFVWKISTVEKGLISFIRYLKCIVK